MNMQNHGPIFSVTTETGSVMPYPEDIQRLGESGSFVDRTIRDIAFITARIASATTMTDTLGYRDEMRVTAQEIQEIMIAAAATASLAGYRIDGDAWRLPWPDASPAGPAVLNALDDLRRVMLDRPSVIKRYALSAKSTIAAKRALALLVLSIEAYRPAEILDWVAIAGLSRQSMDIRGDAQHAAEMMDLAGSEVL